MTIHSYTLFVCEVCNKTFRSKQNFVTHIKKMHTHCFPCNVCELSFLFEHHLKLHMLHDHKNPSSDNSVKTFQNQESLQTHKVMNTDDKPFSCEDNKILKDRTNLPDREIKSFQSPDFARDMEFESEITLQMEIDETLFHCNWCDKKFKSDVCLQRHMVIHNNNNKPFTCDICNESFKYRMHLLRHKKKHISEDKFVCDFCSQKFSKCLNLKHHMKMMHTGHSSKDPNF